MRIQRVKTASGATAVQLVRYRGGRRQVVERLGCARDAGELAVLEQLARERIPAGQPAFDLDGLVSAPAVESGTKKPRTAAVVSGGARVVGSRPGLLWEVLGVVYGRIGFDTVIGSVVFRRLVLSRVIAPGSKTAMLRMLAEMDVADAPAEATM